MHDLVLTADNDTTVSASGQKADTVVSNVADRRVQKVEGSTDSDLLKAFREGDEAAFVQLYKQRHLEIYRYILHFVRGDEALAADIFQDTFIKVHNHLASLCEDGNVRAWMYAVARNTCINNLKRENREVRLGEHHSEIRESDSSRPDMVMHRNHLYQELDSAIAGLPENQREAILLREFEGLTYSEIAKATRTNVGVVRQRLWRAKQSLRNSLAGFFPGSSGSAGLE